MKTNRCISTGSEPSREAKLFVPFVLCSLLVLSVIACGEPLFKGSDGGQDREEKTETRATETYEDEASSGDSNSGADDTSESSYNDTGTIVVDTDEKDTDGQGTGEAGTDSSDSDTAGQETGSQDAGTDVDTETETETGATEPRDTASETETTADTETETATETDTGPPADPCELNPCSEPRTVCEPGGSGGYTCSCPPSTCDIGAGCVADGSLNPDNECEWCNAAEDDASYTDRMDGASCADDGHDCTVNTCQAGSCGVGSVASGCFIDDACYGDGAYRALQGDGVCQVCDHGIDPLSWTPAGDGQTCDLHKTCKDGACLCAPGLAGNDCDRCVLRVDVSNTSGIEDGASWETAFRSVQPAIDAAVDVIDQHGHIYGCEVWVAKGTYYVYESSVEDTISMAIHVDLYGGFDGDEGDDELGLRDWEANPTVLSGCISAGCSLQVRHVVTGGNSNLDGFIIRGGRAEVDAAICLVAEPPLSCYGGGMLNDNLSPNVSNCTFMMNDAYFGGGMANIKATPNVSNCTFMNNSAENGGGMSNHGASPNLVETSFTGNAARNLGAAMLSNENWSARPVKLTDCVIENNSGIGARNEYALLEISGCTFAGNDEMGLQVVGGTTSISRSYFVDNAFEGLVVGGSTSAPTLTMESSVVARNGRTGIGLGYTQATLTNCTIVKNGDGGITYYVGHMNLINSIVFGNGETGSNDIPSTSSNQYTIVNSIVGNELYGAEPIVEDPLLADIDGGDYTLTSLSLAVDGADSTLSLTGDILGNARKDCPNPNTGVGFADIGAYEYQCP